MDDPDRRRADRRARLRKKHAACLAGELADVAGISTNAVYANVRNLVEGLDLPVALVNRRWRRVDD